MTEKQNFNIPEEQLPDSCMSASELKRIKYAREKQAKIKECIRYKYHISEE